MAYNELHVLSVAHAKALHDKLEAEIQLKANSEDVNTLFDKYFWQFDAEENKLHFFDEDGNDALEPIEINVGANLAEYNFSYDKDTQELCLVDSNGDVAIDPIWIGGGGSGGGGGGAANPAVLTIANRMDWLSTTISGGASCPITINWASTIDDIPTGSGILKVTINSSIAATVNAAQGDVTFDVGTYLKTGTNSIKLSISDAYNNTKSLIYSVNVIAISLSSSFDNSVTYNKAFLFPYTPMGAISKTIHIKLDGTEQGTIITNASNRQLTYSIPAQTHGKHSIEMWFTVVINGETISSNHLYYEYVYVVSGSTDVIITTSFNSTTVSQYSNNIIKYSIYDPSSPEAPVVIKEDDVIIQDITVDRTEHQYTYRPMTSGSHTLKIESGESSRTFNITVTAVDVDAVAETEGLLLYLTAAGRSNGETPIDRKNWFFTGELGQISSQFSNFNWSADGWQHDDDGATVLRLRDDARVSVRYPLFETDFKTTGRTIEFEFATHEVRDYDASIISCMSNGRGINITSQAVTFKSQGSNVYTQFKEDEHIRVAFTIEKNSENRLIICYINGIASSAVQYPETDNFAQSSPVYITLGCSDATVDIYNIRVYNHNLTRFQIVNNWIADTQNGALMLERYIRNNVFDAYGNIVKEKLPSYLPYMIINGDLPQYKGNKLTVSGEYVDILNPSKSFTFENAQIDVQGTSSQYYARKNYKIKFNGGFTNNGTTVSKYAMNDNAIPTKTFTFKADVASSEGANNVELVRLYNDICTYKTPYQEANNKIRQGIDGFPIVIFHNDNDNITFLGKYNFNNDKGTEEVYGFQEGDESWEIKTNNTNRVLWKDDDFSDFSSGGWLNDFEGRYPDGNEDPTNLNILATWLKSTDQEQATGNNLASSIVYDGVTYTTDTAEYRLAKFKNEITNYMELESIIFYYLFTEIFLMVDSRAKNAFPSFLGGDKWCMLPYDFDTALGINNEGALVFSYNLEDIDTINGEPIYNGQRSVLWINLRQAFPNEIKTMYQTLRSTNKLSYDIVNTMFENHQSKWSEVIFNEDAQFKYLDPLINEGSGLYLPMLQGSKEAQRKWWLYNRFKYLDSKYNAAAVTTDRIIFRATEVADINITPYADIYASVLFGGDYLVSMRAPKNTTVTLVNPLQQAVDADFYIYSCSQLASVGDLSGLKLSIGDFSKAIKLQDLTIGSADANYVNPHLRALTLGNNTLLKSIDARNCTGLNSECDTPSINLSGCLSLENVYFDGTGITGISLPNGGSIKTLHLPETINNLTILNQTKITEFECPNLTYSSGLSSDEYNNLSTLWLDNVSTELTSADEYVIDAQAILEAMEDGGNVRLYNFQWEFDTVSDVENFYDKLDNMKGLDQNGNSVDTAQVYGIINIAEAVTGEQITTLKTRQPHITLQYKTITSNIYYYDYYGTTLEHTEQVSYTSDKYGAYSCDGSWTWAEANANKPENTPAKTFGNFLGWSLDKESSSRNPDAQKNVIIERTLYAVYATTIIYYSITFKLAAEDGGTTLRTKQFQYNQIPIYDGNEPVSSRGENYKQINWTPELAPVTAAATYEAVFGDVSDIARRYLLNTLTEVENQTISSISSYALYNNDLTKLILNNPTGVEIKEHGLFTYNTNISLIKLIINKNIPTYAGNQSTINELDITPVGNNVTSFNGPIASNCFINKTILHVNKLYSCNTSGLGFSYWSKIYIDDTSNAQNPDELINEYKNGTNWSQFASIIYPFSDYQSDDPSYIPVDTITDTWDEIFTHCSNGDATSYYNTGDTKTLTLTDGTDVCMQIAGFSKDITNNNHYTAISWISRDIALTQTVYLSNWENSNIRSYLNTTWFDLLPQNIQNSIQTVIKSDPLAGTTVNDKIWVPSRSEISDNNCLYSDVYFNTFTRKKMYMSNNTPRIREYILRDMSDTTLYQIPTDGSGVTTSTYNQSRWISVGFCTGIGEEMISE